MIIRLINNYLTGLEYLPLWLSEPPPLERGGA
jgi:hypothetical protein